MRAALSISMATACMLFTTAARAQSSAPPFTPPEAPVSSAAPSIPPPPPSPPLPPLPPLERPVLVSFQRVAAPDRPGYVVTVVSSIGTRTCSVPCELRLPPGSATLSVTGDGTFDRPFVVPALPTTVEVGYGNPMPAFIFGVIASILGFPVMVLGLIETPLRRGLWPVAVSTGAALTAGGVVNLIVASGPMTGPYVRMHPTQRAVGRRATPLRFAGAGAAPLASGGGLVAFAFEF